MILTYLHDLIKSHASTSRSKCQSASLTLTAPQHRQDIVYLSTLLGNKSQSQTQLVVLVGTLSKSPKRKISSRKPSHQIFSSESHLYWLGTPSGGCGWDKLICLNRPSLQFYSWLHFFQCTGKHECRVSRWAYVLFKVFHSTAARIQHTNHYTHHYKWIRLLYSLPFPFHLHCINSYN